MFFLHRIVPQYVLNLKFNDVTSSSLENLIYSRCWTRWLPKQIAISSLLFKQETCLFADMFLWSSSIEIKLINYFIIIQFLLKVEQDVTLPMLTGINIFGFLLRSGPAIATSFLDYVLTYFRQSTLSFSQKSMLFIFKTIKCK